MDALTAFVAGVVASVRAALDIDVCPGGWPWAVSVFGVAVGLLPTAGAVLVAVLRRRAGLGGGFGGSAVAALAGLVCAGLLPLAVFAATGEVFAAAAAGSKVAGLSSAEVADLDGSVCFVGSQAQYLGGYSVAEAFDPASPLRLVLALFLLAGMPLLAAVFVAAQARLALRRGPSWPSKLFWVPFLALSVVTAGTPAGSSGHLWVGVTAGAFVGIAVVLMVGTPRPAVARAPAPPPARPAAAGSRRPGWSVPPSVQERGRVLADRLVERFAARQPLPPVVPGPRAVTPAPPPAARPAVAGHRPTLVAAAPPFGAEVTGTRFRLVRRLGDGGFGRVWLAHDSRLGHPVALKAAHAPDGETEERIRREAGALAAVRHPHCVRIYDMVAAASDAGLREFEGLVIVMEYVEGSSLADLVLARGVIDDVFAARLWSGVAGALEAAHGQGVMHRDVKPGNVVVDPAGTAHLIDFGIARRTGDATLTMAGFVLGTPDFLAPEVAAGERATPASDAWQLAATVSYALTGQPPRGEHPDAVSGLRAAAVGAPLRRLPQRSAHVALLRAAMETDPRRRPSLRAVQEALAEWLRRAGVPVGPEESSTVRMR